MLARAGRCGQGQTERAEEKQNWKGRIQEMTGFKELVSVGGRASRELGVDSEQFLSLTSRARL